MKTPRNDPPMRESDESTREQLSLAKAQGEALQRAVKAMDEESDSGVLVERGGDYEVAVAVESAEGMWMRDGGEMVWRNPESENCHIEVCVRDAADGRFIPALEVEVSVAAPDGTAVGTHRHPFLWHPWLYHYGRNWEVPEDGEYRVEVRVSEPEFPRHDHVNGRRYLEPVSVAFARVPIERGQKLV